MIEQTPVRGAGEGVAGHIAYYNISPSLPVPPPLASRRVNQCLTRLPAVFHVADTPECRAPVPLQHTICPLTHTRLCGHVDQRPIHHTNVPCVFASGPVIADSPA
jgi:hypothetical protein